MTITALPSAPLLTDDSATFNSKAFALLGALAQFVTECNAAAASVPIPGGGTLTGNLLCLNTGLQIKDTSGAQSLILKANEVLTAQRTLNLILGDVSRTLTLSGNVALNQNLRTTDAVVFTGIGDGIVTPYIFSAGHQARITGANTANYSAIIDCTSVTGTAQQVLQVSTPNVTGNSATGWFISVDDSTANRGQWRLNGGIANYSANNVNLASDENIKSAKQTLDIPRLWNAHKSIEWCMFKYYDQTHDDWNYGYMNQNVELYLPEIIDDEKNGDKIRKVIYQEDLHNIGHAVVAECQRRIEALEARI